VIVAGSDTPVDPPPSWNDLSTARFTLRIAYRFDLITLGRVIDDEIVRAFLSRRTLHKGQPPMQESDEHPRRFPPGTAPPVYLASDTKGWILE